MNPLSQALLDRHYFEDLKKKVFGGLAAGEHLFVNYGAESSQFVRINAAKVRQIGTVTDANLDLTLVYESAPGVLHKASRCLTLTGISYLDQEEITRTMAKLKMEVRQLPQDPYAELPRNLGSSSVENKGSLLSVESAPKALLSPVENIDIAGIYASGPSVRAMANSAGLTHWFTTETFSFDYSFYTPNQRALKGTFAGTHWDEKGYLASIEQAREQLKLLDIPAKKVERGSYRTYLAPAAVSDLVGMFSWGAVSEASIRQGGSPLLKVRNKEMGFSKRFTLSEDFSGGEAPRFNAEGELAPERLPLIAAGELQNTLVNQRTAKEYEVAANGADGGETLRSASVAGGGLDEERVLKALGSGLYLSNLHYLNWSDQSGGRITGMTRYACFWVENGQIVAPIENMRWDDSIFSLFGTALEDLTRKPEYIPEVGSYGMRSLGGMRVPGMLVTGMRFTL